MVQLYLGPFDHTAEKLHDMEKASKQSVLGILKKIRSRIGFYPLYNLIDQYRLSELNIAQNKGTNDKMSI